MRRRVDPRRLAQYAQLALGLSGFLRARLDPEEAVRQLRARLANREQSFMRVARTLVYENPGSPYRALLHWAGCEYADLERSVRSNGIEQTLEALRDAGVYLSLEEFKARRPIERAGFTIETAAADFDNPLVRGRLGISGATSGSRTRSTRVNLDWDGLAEEAVNELALYTTHGLADAPLALWLPPPPGLAGIRNVVVNAKFSRPPARWFSPVPAGASSRDMRVSTAALIWTCRLFGVPAPRPEFIAARDAEAVARWLAEGTASGQRRVLSAFTSAAVRVAAAALERDLDVSGNVVFATGEPLNERRRRFMQAAGLQAFSRYVAAETGVIAGGCGRSPAADGMHLYTDRIAAIPMHSDADSARAAGAILFTTLSQHTGKVVFNVDLGDRSRLERRPCACVFGELGLDSELSHLQSSDRLTAEGATLFAADLDEVVGALIERAGGSPDDYQLQEGRDQKGLPKVVLAVSPDVSLHEAALVDEVLSELASRGAAGRIAADLWREGRVLQVVRSQPQPTDGFKLPTLAPTGRDGHGSPSAREATHRS